MWVNRREYENLVRELKELKDDSGEATVQRLTHLARQLKIDVHSDQWQEMAQTVFLNIGGRELPMLKGYSQTKFMADTPEDILKRVQEAIVHKSPLKHKQVK